MADYDDIDKILKNSSKAELLEILPNALESVDKVIVILITDRENGNYHSQVMTLGINHSYEAYGILKVAEQDLKDDE